MIVESLAALEIISGLIFVGLAILFLRKDVSSLLNQLMSLATFSIGISLLFDSIPLLISDAALYALTEYILAFTLGISVACFFLAGITLVKGEYATKNPVYFVPTLGVSIIPGGVILLTQSVQIESAEILGESVLVASWGEIGDLLILGVFIFFFFGGLFYFYTIYPQVEGVVKTRLAYFLIGMLFLGVSTVISSLLYVIIEDPFFGTVISLIGTYGSIAVGSVIIIYGFMKPNTLPNGS
ncbi:MAG: hypothetical protein ACFFC7_30515 [Candidatus Hermodarchaeota archaeon]